MTLWTRVSSAMFDSVGSASCTAVASAGISTISLLRAWPTRSPLIDSRYDAPSMVTGSGFSLARRISTLPLVSNGGLVGDLEVGEIDHRRQGAERRAAADQRSEEDDDHND